MYVVSHMLDGHQFKVKQKEMNKQNYKDQNIIWAFLEKILLKYFLGLYWNIVEGYTYSVRKNLWLKTVVLIPWAMIKLWSMLA